MSYDLIIKRSLTGLISIQREVEIDLNYKMDPHYIHRILVFM